jgi:hypothetical protein
MEALIIVSTSCQLLFGLHLWRTRGATRRQTVKFQAGDGPIAHVFGELSSL